MECLQLKCRTRTVRQTTLAHNPDSTFELSAILWLHCHEMASDLAQQILGEKPIDRLLLESPQDVPASSFGMDDPAKEAAFIAKLKCGKRLKQIDRFENLPLFKTGNTIFSEDD